jgi:alpha-beta hydrolase superfamily lysophospholipase
MKISEWIWKSFDGLDMYGPRLGAESQPKAVIVLVHGLGEHCGWHAHIGAMLAEKGYALLGFDLRGHGKSGGPRGHTPSFEAFMKDIDSMFEQASARYPGIRQFI